MLILGPSYPAKWDGRPPGMTHEDWPIWMIWRWAGLIKHDYYHYNVRIGTPATTPSSAPDNYRRQWELSSLFRIDAIGISEKNITLYEIKSFATPEDLWQVLMYRDLLTLELQQIGSFSTWVIAESFLPKTQLQAKALNVNTWSPTRRN